MPSTSEILDGLRRISNTWIAISVAWHIALALAAALFTLRSWRPGARATAIASSLPLVSVAALAGSDGNPFNAGVFTIAAVLLWGLSRRIESRPVEVASSWRAWSGGALILFGWVYPHFLDGQSPWLYAIAAPLGLIPCPTLSVVIGVSLCFDAFGARAWGIVTGVLGLFYGVFGVARLGVWLDFPLILGAIVAIVASSRRHPSARVTPNAPGTIAAALSGGESR